jgi:hypothetical protein
MSPLQIKRQRNANVDPKQVLRAHIDQLPVEKQREFITSAFQLMAERTRISEANTGASYQRFRQDVKQ